MQRLVELYLHLTEASNIPNYTPPFSRHVSAAKKILTWAQNDPEKALGAVYDCWLYFADKGLNWTLDTVYNYIPRYEREEIYHSHSEPSQDEIWAEEIRKTQERIKELM